MITRSIALVVATMVGCAQSPSPSPEQQTQAGISGAEPQEMHGPPGPGILLFAALHHLDLSAEQRTTIENAAHSIAPDMPFDHRVFAEVAAGVRAGKIDESRVLAIFDATGPSGNGSVSPASALATLHATLRPEQRRALVDVIAQHMDEHESAMAAGSPGPEGRLEHVLSKLNLTSEQRASIDRIVAAQPSDNDGATMHAHLEAFHAGLRAGLDTFATDTFDAAAFASPPSGTTGMRDHVQRTLHIVAAILPVLDPAQREELAATIEAGPRHH